MKHFNFLKVALMSLVLHFAFCVHGYTQMVVFSENFTSFSGGSAGSGAGSTDRGTSLDSYTQISGWLGSKVYEAGGAIKMGTTSVAGYIQTPAIDLSEDSGAFVISFKSMAWSGDSTYLYMHIMNADTITETITVRNLGNSPDYEWGEYEFNLTTGGSATKIKFEAVAGSRSRFFLEDLEISQILPLPFAAAPVFIPTSQICYAPQAVTITCETENAAIYYTTNNTTPDSTTGTLYTESFIVSSTTTVKAIAYKEGMERSALATATYTFPVEVANIAAFKSAGATATNGTIFKITGDVIFVYQNGINIFVQDETGGLLIRDNEEIATNTYAEGNIISGGIYGTYILYNQLKEMYLTQDLPNATPDMTNDIAIPTVTVAQIKANYNVYETKLVKIVYAVFEEGTFSTTEATNINFAQYGTDTLTCRNHFATLSNMIEEGSINEVTGFVLRYNDDIQLIPRTNTDIAPYAIPVVSTPVIDLPSGNYLRDTLAVITCDTEGTIIYYTLNNTEPTIASSKYTAPVTIFGNQTLKAMAVKLGYNNSDVATATYTFPAYAEVPYTNGFEDEEGGNWVIVNGTAVNKWMVGQAQDFDNNKLFISSTNGATNKYDATSAATVHAYRTISIPANGAYLAFDYRLGGDANDYLAVSLLREGTAVTAGTIPTDAVVLAGSNEWQEYLALLEEGTYRLVFTWVNNNSGENQFPAAIDNISLQNIPCGKPSNIVVELVDGNTSDEAKANVSWTAADGQNSWIVEYGEVGKSTVYTKNVSGTQEVELSPLNRYSTYEISVKANCGEEQSLAETRIINVPCSNLDQGEIQTAESTGTANLNLPIGNSYYNYGYSQQIIDAGTLPKGSLKSISFYCTQIPNPSGRLGATKIWLGMTDKSTFASTTDFVNPAEMTLVLDMGAGEAWNLSSTGWQTLIFDTEFFYDGVSNLVIAFDEGLAGYTSYGEANYAKFEVESTTGYKSIYMYNDNRSTINYANPAASSTTKTRVEMRNVLKFSYEFCSDQILCETPQIEIGMLTHNSAVIQWENNNASTQNWIIEYKETSAPSWTSQTTTDSSVILSDLNSNTEYEVRAKAVCGVNNESEYSDIVTFITLFGCTETPQNITSLPSSNSVTITWESDTYDSWEVQLKKNNENEWNTFVVNETMITFSSLDASTSYDFRVRALCGDNHYTAWATYNFISGCEPYMTLPVEEQFANNRIPDCWINYDNAWSFSGGTASSTGTTPNNWLITNGFRLPEINDVTLSFDLAISTEATERLEILVSDRGTNSATFTPLYVATANSVENTTYSIVLPEYLKGEIVYLAFVHNTPTSNATLALDNVIISSCFEVPTLEVVFAGESYATLTWEANTATQWNLEYVKGMGNNWTSIIVDSNKYEVTGLDANSTYRFRLQSVCSETEKSLYSEIVSATTSCDMISRLPFIENFDKAPQTGQGRILPCWSTYKTTTANGLPYIANNAADRPPTSPNYLDFHHTQTGFNIVVLPVLADNIDVQTIQMSFKAFQRVLNQGHFLVGIMSDPADPDSFVVVDTVTECITANTWYDHTNTFSNYTGTGRYIALKMMNGQGTTQNTFLVDNMVIDIDHVTVENCKISSLAVSTQTTFATVSWEANNEVSEWIVEYKIENDDNYTSVATVRIPTATINGLVSGITYNVRVKAICADNESDWAVASFTTTGFLTNVPYVTGFEDDIDNSLWIFRNTGTRNDWYIGNATFKDEANSLYISNNKGVSNSYIHSGCQVWTYRDFYFTPSDSNYVFSFDWKCTGESTYDWLSVYIGTPQQVEPLSSTTTSEPSDAIKFNNPLKGTQYFNGQSNWVHFETVLNASQYAGTVQRLYFRWRNDNSGGSLPIAIDNVSFVAKGDTALPPTYSTMEMEVVSVDAILDQCDLTNIPVSFTVRQNSTAPITEFTARYTTANAMVEETVILSDTLRQGDEYKYTFSTPANFIQENNYLLVEVIVEGDYYLPNNALLFSNFALVAPATIPYYQDFSSMTIGKGGYLATDANNDNITWTVQSGKLQMTANDMLNANDWFLTTCLDIPIGKYEISYDYNALNVFTESFDVYCGVAPNPAGMIMPLASHTGFSKASTDYRASHIVDVPFAGTYYLGLHATSLAGNAGITFDNLSIRALSDVTITSGDHGSVLEEGLVTVYQNEPMTISIAPDAGYHVSGIYVNGELVEGENIIFPNYQFFTFTPDQAEVIVHVEFIKNTFTIMSSINTYLDRVTGTITPEGIVEVDYGGSQSYQIHIAEHFHLHDVLINGESAKDQLTVIDEYNFSYAFEQVRRNSIIQVIVAIDSVNVTVHAHSGIGNICGMPTDATDAEVVYTYSVPFWGDFYASFVPGRGYGVNTSYNGVNVGFVEQYNLFDITSNHVFDVYFTKKTYTVTTQVYGNGMITDGVTIEYNPDYVYNYTVAPNPGYYIASVMVNGIEQTITNPDLFTGSLSDIAEDYNIVVRFALHTYQITATAGNGGSIAPNGTTTYGHGAVVTYEINADQGYYIASVNVDGTLTNYTATDNMVYWSQMFVVEQPHAIEVTFATHSYTIAATAGIGGLITPSGTNTYDHGAMQVYNITPNTGYYISTVTVDGEVVAGFGGNTYTFANITENHTIAVAFTQHQYTITSGVAAGGTISPVGTTTVPHGASQVYSITAATGYTVSTVAIDGAEIAVNAATYSHTFSDVTANHDIFANFAIKTYTVTVAQPENGTIAPGTQVVDHGSSVTFRVTPNEGYTIENIKVNGSNVAFTPDATDAVSHTISNITANTTITATMKIKTFTIMALAGANGTITPSGTATVNYGGSQAYTITANAGYMIENVVIDGAPVGAVNSFAFANVTSNRTITATFIPITCNAPINLHTTEITYTTAKFNWVHDGADSYTVTYVRRGDNNGTIIPNITENYVEVQDLDTNTYYDWTVKAVCGSVSESTDAIYATFKTAKPTIVGIDDFDPSQITVYSNQTRVYIVNDAGLVIQCVDIYDIYGKLIYKGSALNNPEIIDLNVAAGTYMVRITTAGKIVTYKVHIANN